jgi:hypothetical protein
MRDERPYGTTVIARLSVVIRDDMESLWFDGIDIRQLGLCSRRGNRTVRLHRLHLPITTSGDYQLSPKFDSLEKRMILLYGFWKQIRSIQHSTSETIVAFRDPN